MFEARRPMGRLFYFVLAVTMMAAQSRAQSPPTTTISEGLFNGRTSDEKKDAAMSFVEAAISLGDAVTNRQIVDEAKFKEGLEQMINGAVECLNASVWAKK